MTNASLSRRSPSEVSRNPLIPKATAGNIQHTSTLSVSTKNPASDYAQGRQYLREHFDRYPTYYVSRDALPSPHYVDQRLSCLDSLPLGYEDAELVWTLNAAEFRQLEQEFRLEEGDLIRYFYNRTRGRLLIRLGPPTWLHDSVANLLQAAIMELLATWPDDAASRYIVGTSCRVMMAADGEASRTGCIPDLLLQHRPTSARFFTPWWVLEVAVSQSLSTLNDWMTLILEQSHTVRAGWAVNVRLAAASTAEEAQRALSVLGPDANLESVFVAIGKDASTQALGPLCWRGVRLVGQILAVDVQYWAVDESGVAQRDGPSFDVLTSSEPIGLDVARLAVPPIVLPDGVTGVVPFPTDKLRRTLPDVLMRLALDRAQYFIDRGNA
ncbi:MAG: hypothetical protein M1826_003261 [Phylliscum demangeonii]|nr:MAG: hypothetical protein M1826_003261 [Phylliscum demangeonii]